MKKKKDLSGLFFSAFLITAFVVCSYFFVGLIDGATALNESMKQAIKYALFAVFGLMLFYATRIGDGKQVKRFSLGTLLLLDIPAVYILLANFASGLPLSAQITSVGEMGILAAVALGYGIPYTFLSGYELDRDVPQTASEEETAAEEGDAGEDEQENADEPDEEEKPQQEEEAAY